MTDKKRISLLDEIRGFCVFCMVFYHAFYTYGTLFDLSFASDAFDFFEPVEPVFAGTFILISGISCRLSRSNIKRGLLLAVVSALITFVTVVLMPKAGLEGGEIYFGILHFLAVAIILFALLHKLADKVNPVIGIIVSAVLFYLFRGTSSGFFGLFSPYILHFPQKLYDCAYLFPLGFANPSFYSADYFPILPWIFLFFLGSFLGVYVASGKVPNFAYRSNLKIFDWLGTHALIIYIVHQPVIYILGALAEYLIGLFK